MLQNLRLRPDGGLDDKRLASLWHAQWQYLALRCFSSVVTCWMIVFNFAYTAKLDLDTVLSDKGTDGFLILNALVPEGEIPLASGAAGVAMLMELLFMVCLYAQACSMLATAIFLPGPQERSRWDLVAKLVWKKVPRLTTASAMRSLCHVHPTVFSHELSFCLETVSENLEGKHKCLAVYSLLKFVCSRVFFLWLGLEGFLVKFRATSRLVNQHSATTENITVAALFLFQVMGTVNLKSIIQDRLNLFIFGGRDCVLTMKEAGVVDFYYAQLSKRLWQSSELGRWRAFVVMTSFTDADFQMIVLDERKTRKTTCTQE